MNDSAERLLEIADEFEEMARGYEEKATQLRRDAARNRFAARYVRIRDATAQTTAQGEKT